MTSDALILDALRTPIGRYRGGLAAVRPDDLAALTIEAIVERNGVDPARIDDVFFGAANQAGEESLSAATNRTRLGRAVRRRRRSNPR